MIKKTLSVLSDNSKPKHKKFWFAPNTSLDVVRDILEGGSGKVRIATGFFSAKGWGLLRSAIGKSTVDLLVGINEPHRTDIKSVRSVIIQEVMDDLKTGYTEGRRQAVEDLIARLERRELRIVNARAMKHHAKLYMVSTEAVVTSANASGKGFGEQVEAGIVTADPEKITYFVNEFDKYLRKSRDLSQELLQSLKKWLKQAPPWDVYLKTLSALEELNLTDDEYVSPTDYQRSMIVESLRSINEYGGNMLIATTGLGKTIIATHITLQLKQSGSIKSALVIGPKAVEDAWRQELFKAGISNEYIVYHSLDKKDTTPDRGLVKFRDIRELITERSLIIIDECHKLGNCKNLLNDPQREAFRRLVPLIERSRCKVLLMTGSPYSKNIKGLNTQLHLLSGRRTEQGITKWHINTVEEFINLPVITQLTTPHVAKYYSQSEGGHPYINFGNEKRYLPSEVLLHCISFSLPFKSQVIRAIRSGCFALEGEPVVEKIIERWVMISWMSSPEALEEIIAKAIKDSDSVSIDDLDSSEKVYKAKFKMPLKERRRILQPIVERIRKMPLQADTKLVSLVALLEEAQKNRKKVIIFSERRPTVAYLAQAIDTLLPQVRTFSTIASRDRDYKPKDYQLEVKQAIRAFAPVANKCQDKYDYTYDLFVTTDAFGVGVNLQDAPIIVNYDLAWTAIEPVQRIGRILRFWIDPRTVEACTFIQDDSDIEEIVRRQNNLTIRHDDSRRILDLPVLNVRPGSVGILPAEVASNRKIESGRLDIDSLAEEAVSPYYQHAARLYKNKEYVRKIRRDIISSKTYLGKEDLLYMQFEYQKKYIRTVYNVRDGKLLSKFSPVQLLNWLECNKKTQRAYVAPETIEYLSDKSLKLWCKKHKVNPESTTRDCTIYLAGGRNKNISNLGKFR